MKIKLASIASALVLSVAIGVGGASPAAAACAAGNPGAKEVLGSIGGAVIGGLIGSRIGSGAGRGAAIAGGVLVGGLIGNRIGNALDCEDVRPTTRRPIARLSASPTTRPRVGRTPIPAPTAEPRRPRPIPTIAANRVAASRPR